jgi:cystathionine beta-lyase
MKKLDVHTRLVGFDPCPGDPHRPAVTPIYQTATFEQESALEFGRYDYSRSGNPTRAVLERLVADLEGAERGFAFASGLAAMTAITRLLSAGDEIVAGDDLYGGAYRLFSRILARTGITVRYADATNPAALAAAIGPRTRLVHIETPTNPRLRIVDIQAAARAAHDAGAILSVDSTAMSPYLQNPLALGADVVMHSATKYLCGHSDVTAGAVATSDPRLAETLYLVQNGEGAALGPFDSYLLLRGLRTLGLRMDRQQATAQKVAEFLAGHPGVERVWYPGLACHPGADLHARQARGPGAVVSFQTGSLEVSRRVAEAARLFAITVSFGGIGSSISLPCRMSHASIPPEVRKTVELPEDLVRVSVGIEDAGDLIRDLSRALDAAGAARADQATAPGARRSGEDFSFGVQAAAGPGTS